ncbi:MAG TPA: glycosyltransferase family 39 protein [Roseiflexaceae bacterium]
MRRALTNAANRPHIRTENAGLSFWRIALELGALLLLLAVGAAGVGLARSWTPTYTADLTGAVLDSGFDLIGVNVAEQNQDFAYTWSSGYTIAQLRYGYNAAPVYRATVRLRAANPQGPQPLTFLANERPLATVTPTTAFQTYQVLLRADPSGDRTLRFAFETQPFSPPGDARELGVILTSITLEPLPSTDWPTVLYVCFLLALLWGWLRWRGLRAGATALICGALIAVLFACYALYRPAPLGFPVLATAAVAASAIGVLLARDAASALALAALALLVTFSGMLWPSWLTDDAFISFRYAQNLVAGNGLVYNVGERVEGYTNFLWTMLAALALWLGGDIVFLAHAAGLAIGLAIVLLTYWLARRLIGPAWALVATLIVATSQSVLIYTSRGSGLETGLFTLLALVGSACAIHPRAWRWSGVIFALATLTRPEGALLMGLTFLHLWLLDPSRADRSTIRRFGALLPMLAGYLLIVAPFFLWRASYYGDLLPNTFYAKTGGGLRQALRGLAYAGAFALTLGGPLVLVCFVPLARGWRAALRRWRGYLWLLIVAYTCYIVAVGGDHFPGDRFFVPLVPWFALTMADGLEYCYGAVQRLTRARWLAPAALAAILIAYSGNALFRGPAFDTIVAGDDESVWIWRELGWWFRDHGNPGESMAAMGAGAVAYYSEHTTIDLLGLTDKHIARVQPTNLGAGPAGHEKRDPAYVLDVRRPTYIPRMWDAYFGGESGLRDRYTLVTIRTRYGRELQVWKRMP